MADTTHQRAQALPPGYRVLLLNMGGPAGLDDVQDYIRQLLADPDMIRLPLARLWQAQFARLIAKRRAPKVIERYKLIGGGSPIGEATQRQAAALAKELCAPVDYAMRYTHPRVGQALAQAGAGSCRWIVIPLYPQYSTVSTLSSLKDLQRQAPENLAYRVVDRHFNDDAYLAALADKLAATLAQADPTLPTHLLFTAHSIPEAYIKRGDPYASEIERTATQVHARQARALPYTLAYQSRVGPVQWRGPALEEVLPGLVAHGVKQLVVQPLSFVSENLETLFDLDIAFKQQCRDAGITAYLRVPTVDESPRYIQALAGLARRVAAEWEGAGNA